MKKMNFMIAVLFLLIGLGVSSCSSTQKSVETENEQEIEVSKEEKKAFESEEGEAVEISDEKTEYEIIIIDPGFYTWLRSIAKPEGYYSQTFLENRNQILVINWNQRVLMPNRFNPNLYELRIDYDPQIDYGYEVNYKLYNYFIYFQRKYNQRLGPWLPRI